MGKLITQSEAAKLRGVTVSAINYLVKRKRIRSIEKFGRVLVYEEDVLNYEALPAGRPSKARAAKKTATKKPAEKTVKKEKGKG